MEDAGGWPAAGPLRGAQTRWRLGTVAIPAVCENSREGQR